MTKMNLILTLFDCLFEAKKVKNKKNIIKTNSDNLNWIQSLLICILKYYNDRVFTIRTIDPSYNNFKNSAAISMPTFWSSLNYKLIKELEIIYILYE